MFCLVQIGLSRVRVAGRSKPSWQTLLQHFLVMIWQPTTSTWLLEALLQVKVGGLVPVRGTTCQLSAKCRICLENLQSLRMYETCCHFMFMIWFNLGLRSVRWDLMVVCCLLLLFCCFFFLGFSNSKMLDVCKGGPIWDVCAVACRFLLSFVE